jgi:hypothetical protein
MFLALIGRITGLTPKEQQNLLLQPFIDLISIP